MFPIYSIGYYIESQNHSGSGRSCKHCMRCCCCWNIEFRSVPVDCNNVKDYSGAKKKLDSSRPRIFPCQRLRMLLVHVSQIIPCQRLSPLGVFNLSHNDMPRHVELVYVLSCVLFAQHFKHLAKSATQRLPHPMPVTCSFARYHTQICLIFPIRQERNSWMCNLT